MLRITVCDTKLYIFLVKCIDFIRLKKTGRFLDQIYEISWN